MLEDLDKLAHKLPKKSEQFEETFNFRLSAENNNI